MGALEYTQVGLSGYRFTYLFIPRMVYMLDVITLSRLGTMSRMGSLKYIDIFSAEQIVHYHCIIVLPYGVDVFIFIYPIHHIRYAYMVSTV